MVRRRTRPRSPRHARAPIPQESGKARSRTSGTPRSGRPPRTPPRATSRSEIHRALAEVERAAQPRPLVEGLVQEAKAEPVYAVVDDGLRRPERIGDARKEELARRPVVVDRPHHLEQLVAARGSPAAGLPTGSPSAAPAWGTGSVRPGDARRPFPPPPCRLYSRLDENRRTDPRRPLLPQEGPAHAHAPGTPAPSTVGTDRCPSAPTYRAS